MSFCKAKVVHQCMRRFCSSVSKLAPRLSNAEARLKRNTMFNKELARQKDLIKRVEKIEVSVKGPPEECTLIMNKDLSTPYNCAMHIGELATKQAVLASVNGQLWDMHRALNNDCELKFLTFKQKDPYHINKVFWRSCSFLLGLLAERTFRDEFYVELHSWPAPDVRHGSFVYDVDLKMDNWRIQPDELRTLTTAIMKTCSENLPFERLEVETDLALEMFEDNRYKLEQIPNIAARSPSRKVTLYRVGDHIDVSRGPMMSNTSVIGRFTITAVQPIDTSFGTLYRFQGVALPMQLPLNHFAYSILTKRAAQLNAHNFPRHPRQSAPQLSQSKM